jgi:hypothetical protein
LPADGPLIDLTHDHSPRDMSSDRPQHIEFEKDFEPGYVNALLFETDFSDSQASILDYDGSRFRLTGGWLDYHTPSSSASTASASIATVQPLAAGLSTKNYMVETRFELQPKTSRGNYRVGVMARVDTSGDQYLTCELIKGDVDNAPRFSHLDGAINTLPSNFVAVAPSDNPGWSEATGTTFIAQLWVTQTDHDGNVPYQDDELSAPPIIVCRIFQEGGRGRQVTLKVGQGSPQWIPDHVGTIGVRAAGRAVRFDYLKVYELYRTGF